MYLAYFDRSVRRHIVQWVETPSVKRISGGLNPVYLRLVFFFINNIPSDLIETEQIESKQRIGCGEESVRRHIVQWVETPSVKRISGGLNPVYLRLVFFFINNIPSDLIETEQIESKQRIGCGEESIWHRTDLSKYSKYVHMYIHTFLYVYSYLLNYWFPKLLTCIFGLFRSKTTRTHILDPLIFGLLRRSLTGKSCSEVPLYGINILFRTPCICKWRSCHF